MRCGVTDARLGLPAALLVGAVALAMRVGHLVLATQRELFHGLFLDARFFAWTAASIRDGEGAGSHPYLLSPLYPYFLALFPGVDGPPEGATLFGPRLVQGVLGALVCVLVAWTACRLATRRAGLLAGLGMALLGPAIHYDAGVLVASLQAFFLTASLALLVRGGAVPSVHAAILAGLLLGAAAALRPTALAVAAVCVLFYWFRSQGEPRATRRAALGLVLGLGLVVAPFTARNALVGGETVLLSANGGFNFWVGNHLGAPGTWEAPRSYDAYRDPLARRPASLALGHEATYREASTWWRDRALADIASEPLAWARLQAWKLILFFHPSEIPQLGYGYGWYRVRSPFLRFSISPTWLFLFALAAPILVRRLAKGANGLSLQLPLVFLWTQVLVIACFFVTGRYRAPSLPIAALLAAISADTLIRACAGERRRAALATSALLILMAAGAHTTLERLAPVADDTGHEDLQRAIAMVRTGRPADAVAAFPDVLQRLDLDSGRAAYADALRELGRSGEAVEQYRTIVARHPRNALAWQNLGILLWEDARDALGAERAFTRALEAEPDLAAARFNFAAVVLVQGRVDEAERSLQQALARPASTSLGAETEEWRVEAERLLLEIERYRREEG